MMSPIKITILGRLPSMNDLIAKNRISPFVGNGLKKKTDEQICWYIKRDYQGPTIQRAQVNFRWFEESTRRDPDNIASAKKFILDSLQKMKVLSGDGWKNIAGLSDEFAVDKENPRVEVIIAPVVMQETQGGLF